MGFQKTAMEGRRFLGHTHVGRKLLAYQALQKKEEATTLDIKMAVYLHDICACQIAWNIHPVPIFQHPGQLHWVDSRVRCLATTECLPASHSICPLQQQSSNNTSIDTPYAHYFAYFAALRSFNISSMGGALTSIELLVSYYIPHQIFQKTLHHSDTLELTTSLVTSCPQFCLGGNSPCLGWYSQRVQSLPL